MTFLTMNAAGTSSRKATDSMRITHKRKCQEQKDLQQ